jgi:hypothetical protein
VLKPEVNTGDTIEEQWAKSATTMRVSVQVGIDRDHATSHGSVLLYCLVKGVAFAKGRTGNDLGPFVVGAQEVGGVPISWPLSELHLRATSDSNSLLYTHSLPLRGPGKYVVSLFPSGMIEGKAAPQALATIEVTVAGQAILPWSPWGASKKEDQRFSHGGALPGMTDSYTSMSVCNPLGDIGNPVPETLLFPKEIPGPGTPLPRLIPDEPDAATHLTMDGNSLVVTVHPQLKIYFPDDHFLTRWWINDHPFVPDPDVEDSNRPTIRCLAARVWYVAEVHFELDFRPERLGAKKGDRIGVQLLYCPNGWLSRVGDSTLGSPFADDIFRPADTSPPPASFSFPSNRIDFVYSGDAANPAAK